METRTRNDRLGMGRRAQREMFTGQMNRTWSLLRSGTVSEGDAPGKLSHSVMG